MLFDRSNLLNEHDLRNIVVGDRLRNDVPPKLESKINVMAKIPYENGLVNSRPSHNDLICCSSYF